MATHIYNDVVRTVAYNDAVRMDDIMCDSGKIPDGDHGTGAAATSKDELYAGSVG